MQNVIKIRNPNGSQFGFIFMSRKISEELLPNTSTEHLISLNTAFIERREEINKLVKELRIENAQNFYQFCVNEQELETRNVKRNKLIW